jgi:acyl-CoA thioester hydrolase
MLAGPAETRYRGAMPPDLDALLADARIVWTEDVLRFADTDANGHINNTLFSVLCESGRVNMFRTRFDPTLPSSRFFVIARLAIDFRAELFYPGRVRTGTWLTKLGRTSVSLAQAVIGGDRLAAEAEAVCVLMHGDTRRPMPFPDPTRQALESMLRPKPE